MRSIEAQEIKNLAVFERFSIKRLNIVEHLLRQVEILLSLIHI